MFIERIKEEKKRLNISSRSMSERSRMGTTEETISRILSGKTYDPGIHVVLDMGETVGLSPYEIFMDSTLAAEFKAFLEIKSKSEETEAERIRLIAENDELKIINNALSQRIAMLEKEITYKDKVLELHDFYRANIDKLIKKEGI